MRLAIVVGTVVATHKDPKLGGAKFLVVEDVDLSGGGQGSFLVAFDAVGAGPGEVVLVAQGSSARQTVMTDGRPVDCTIMAIVDVVETGGEVRYEKSAASGS
ncbi:MAG: EutN/CcmL family microcompartment protein, partial [Actinomycetota bacterium]